MDSGSSYLERVWDRVKTAELGFLFKSFPQTLNQQPILFSTRASSPPFLWCTRGRGAVGCGSLKVSSAALYLGFQWHALPPLALAPNFKTLYNLHGPHNMAPWAGSSPQAIPISGLKVTRGKDPLISVGWDETETEPCQDNSGPTGYTYVLSTWHKQLIPPLTIYDSVKVQGQHTAERSCSRWI